MGPIRRRTFLIWLMFISTPLFAETLANRDLVRQQTGAFMDMIASGRVAAAYNSMRPYLGIEPEVYDLAVREAATYFQQVNQTLGDAVGSSRVKVEVIANDFTRETWLQKFEADAIAWHFTYYQPDGNGWKLVEVRHSTDLDRLFRPPE